MRNPTLIATLLAATFLAGPAFAQTGTQSGAPTGQSISPSPMPPGSRAGDAPGMGSLGGHSEGRALGTPSSPGAGGAAAPGSTATPAPGAAGRTESGGLGSSVPGGTTAPGDGGAMPRAGGGATTPSQTGPASPANPGAAAPANPSAGAPASPGTAAPGRSGAAAPNPSTTAPNSATDASPNRAVPVPSGPGVTEQQARTLLSGAGYSEIQQLERTPNGGWRARATRDGRQGDIAIGTDGEVTAIQ